MHDKIFRLNMFFENKMIEWKAEVDDQPCAGWSPFMIIFYSSFWQSLIQFLKFLMKVFESIIPFAHEIVA